MHNKWSSTLSFILASAGAAIGLGTIWYAPYVIGNHGGANCLYLYILMTMLIGLPILHLEIQLGIRGQRNITDSIKHIAAEENLSLNWQYLGLFSLFMLFGILSFYIIVGAKVFNSALFALVDLVKNTTPSTLPPAQSFFSLFSGSMTFGALTFLMCFSSLRNGIEKSIYFMMPIYFLTLIYLLIIVQPLTGFSTAITYLFIPRLQEIDLQTFISATGLAFFTLATGAGCMLNYGAYLRSTGTSNSVLSSNAIIAAMIVMTTALSCILVFAITFTYNIAPQQGPDLVFSIIPHLMHQFGAWASFGKFIFFFLLLLAALTSSISLLEPVIRFLSERFHHSRMKSGLYTMLVLALSSMTYSASEFSMITPGLLERVSTPLTNYGLPLGALLYLCFALLSKTQLCQPKSGLSYYYINICVHIICPCALILLLGSSLL